MVVLTLIKGQGCCLSNFDEMVQCLGLCGGRASGGGMASLAGGIHLSTSVTRKRISLVTGCFILSHTAENIICYLFVGDMKPLQNLNVTFIY